MEKLQQLLEQIYQGPISCQGRLLAASCIQPARPWLCGAVAVLSVVPDVSCQGWSAAHGP